MIVDFLLTFLFDNEGIIHANARSSSGIKSELNLEKATLNSEDAVSDVERGTTSWNDVVIW